MGREKSSSARAETRQRTVLWVISESGSENTGTEEKITLSEEPDPEVGSYQVHLNQKKKELDFLL